MKSPHLVLLAALLWPAATVSLHAADKAIAPIKPNIVFFLADDLGYMDIGANNPKTFYETPNIDTLAAKGMRFTQGYAACPVCSPTRASIMTGKYPARVGVTAHIGAPQPDKWNRPTKLLPAPYQEHLALEEVTIAEALRDGGYTNLFAGKWHLGDGEFSPNAQGFGPGLQGQKKFYYPADSPATDPKNDPKTTDRIADAAVRFIEANQDRPFFAYLPFQAVHMPIGARPDLVEKYRQKKATAPPDAWGTERASKVRLVQNHAAYAAMIEQLDTAIGRVLAALDRNGLAERTIVVFMSDDGGLSTAEGWPTSNLPLRGGKGWLYEGGIREPMIMRAPGVTKPGSICGTPVTSTDFYPTLLELAGLPPRPQQHVDGMSLVPLLKGNSLARGPLFWHYPHYHGNQGGAPGGAVRDGDWKLIEWYEDRAPELFNLRDDLEEKRNAAAAHPAKVKQLRSRLAEWRKEVSAVMPTPNPKYNPQGADAGRGQPADGKLALTNFHDSLVPKGFVLSEPDWHIWCNAPILDDQGRVHLFVSRWAVKDTFGFGWHTTCEIAHYTADKPEGPYSYISTVLKGSGMDGSWRKAAPHNVSVVRLPDRRYAMLLIANSNGTVGFPANQKIGMLLATTLDGPWQPAGQDGLILDVPDDPAIWSHGSVVGVNNPTLLPMPDGRFLLYYKAMKPGKGEVRRMGVAIAAKADGPYRFEKEALTANEGTIEDGFGFLLNGEVCLLVTDCHGKGYGGGMIYHSKDGIHFDPQPIRAYEPVDHYLKRWPNPAKGWSPWVLQRPALLFDQAGVPTHLFAPCGTPPEGKQGTATFLFEIRPGKLLKS